MFIIHTGNIFLDKPIFAYSKLSSSSVRREIQREVCTRIINITKERDADALLIAGNLFDAECVTLGTCSWLTELFKQLSPKPVLIVPGESDPPPEGYAYLKYKFPNNVKVFDSPNIEIWSDKNLPISVCGYPGRISNEVLAQFPQRDKEKFLLLAYDWSWDPTLSHTAYIETHKTWFSPFVYVALGKIKSYSECYNSPELAVCYCGKPNPMDFSDTPPFGILGIHLDKKDTQWILEQIEYIPTPLSHYYTITINCTETFTQEQLLSKLREEINPLASPKIIHIQFTGTLTLPLLIKIPELIMQISTDCEDISWNVHTEVHELTNLIKNNPKLTFTEFFNQLNEERKNAPNLETQETVHRAIVVSLSTYYRQKVGLPKKFQEKGGTWNW